MATPKITAAAIKKASDEGYYLKLGPRPSKLHITGSDKRWMNVNKETGEETQTEHVGDLYVRKLRLVGSEAEIRSETALMGYPQNEIDAFISGSYTFANSYMENSPLYKERMAEIDENKTKRGLKSRVAGEKREEAHLIEFSQLRGILENSKAQKQKAKEQAKTEKNSRLAEKQQTRAQVAPKEGKASKESRTTRSKGEKKPAQSRGTGSMCDRMKLAHSKEKVVDVSNWTGSDHDGVKAIECPSKGKKVVVCGSSPMIALASSSSENFCRAINELVSETGDQGYMKYMSEFDEKMSQRAYPKAGSASGSVSTTSVSADVSTSSVAAPAAVMAPAATLAVVPVPATRRGVRATTRPN
jgi:hypothetical protein